MHDVRITSLAVKSAASPVVRLKLVSFTVEAVPPVRTGLVVRFVTLSNRQDSGLPVVKKANNIKMYKTYIFIYVMKIVPKSSLSQFSSAYELQKNFEKTFNKQKHQNLFAYVTDKQREVIINTKCLTLLSNIYLNMKQFN